MKITVGLDRSDTPERIRELAAAGADEFFAGYVPPEWSDRFGWEVSPNHRRMGPSYQYTNREQLRAAVDAIHALSRPIAITFNAFAYNEVEALLLREIVDSVDALGPDGYIVASPATMLLFRDWGVQKPITLSTCAACYNSEAVRFLAELGDVRRVILPRKLTLSQMKALTAELQDLDLEFEAMVLDYRCFFNDEFCFSWHSGPGKVLCLCYSQEHKATSRRLPPDWKRTFEEVFEDPSDQFEPGSALDRFYEEMATPYCAASAPARPAAARATGGRRPELTRRLVRNCGLCAIPRLREAGVSVLKLPLRGQIWKKLRCLHLVRAAVESPDQSPEFFRALLDSPAFCATPGSCYYDLRTNDV